MTVSSLITDASARTTSLLSQSTAATNAAIAAVGNVGFVQLSYNPTALPAQPVIPSDIPLPTFDTITLDLPADPGSAPAFQAVSAIEVGTVPTLTATAPTISLPGSPTPLADFTVPLPSITTTFAFPDAPAALANTAIDAPVLPDRAEPVRPATALPAFTAVAPTDVPVAPTNLPAQYAAAQAAFTPATVAQLDGMVDAFIAKNNPRFAAGMAAIETQLAKYLAGGTALSADIETAIYERMRAKMTADNRRGRDTLYAEAADRGFAMPGGSVLAGVARLRADSGNALAAAAREIAVAQADMEQKNLQFAVTQSTNLRQMILTAALNYHGNLVQISAQAITHGKNTVDIQIAMYEQLRQAFVTRLEVYKAEATVYATRLDAALAEHKLYQENIKALEILGNIDRNKVEVYKARMDVLNVLANVYRSQIDAVVSRANLEKLKIDLFGAQVQAFDARVRAKESELGVYKATIEGQNAGVQLYSAQVNAHDSNVRAFSAVISAKAEAVRAQTETNRGLGENFRAVMDGYRTVVSARGDVARTRLEVERGKTSAYDSATRAQVAKAELRNSYYRTIGDITIKNAELSLNTLFRSAQLGREYASSLAQLHGQNASVFASVAGASQSGLNTLVSESTTT